MTGVQGISPGYYPQYPPMPISSDVMRTMAFTNNLLADASQTAYQPMPQQAPQKKKSGGLFGAIKDIGKGFINGGVNFVKSLTTPKGLLMAAGTIGLVAATGGAALPFLIGAGAVMGGAQVLKGAASGNWQGVGEGLFTVAGSVAGGRIMPKLKTPGGATFDTSQLIARNGSAWARISGTVKNFANALIGRKKITGTTAQGANASISLPRYLWASLKNCWNTGGAKQPLGQRLGNIHGRLRTEYAGGPLAADATTMAKVKSPFQIGKGVVQQNKGLYFVAPGLLSQQAAGNQYNYVG